ncbi:hypothetical protein K435DRAFT_967917 [Dendrothele bispora CBS 962.96]|uniref:VWFA domain-containing protein n=1 Tax=Dendrothele bispora (strain CBS 962.96) TaxID=1314807 RepID=A0A4V4HEP4_DENBC|nr:hypothetical protein K435DRAFT_967917 [Dendrothele bispora CBS 962.96]
MGNSSSRSDTHLSVNGNGRSHRRSTSKTPHSSGRNNHSSNNSGRLSIVATSGVPGTRRSRSVMPADSHNDDDDLPPPYKSSHGSSSHPSSRKSSLEKLEGKKRPSKHSSTTFSSVEKSTSLDNKEARELINRHVSHATSSILKGFDTVIIVDDSSSMRDGGRWTEAGNALSELADFAGQYDADGLDIYFLNNEAVGKNIRNAEQVREMFSKVQPCGVTNIGASLEKLLYEYIDLLDDTEEKEGKSALRKIKPVNYIVITDGEATDDPESVIVQAAKRLDVKFRPMTQVGIQFVQIGPLQSAARFLERLDDTLGRKHRIRDIVDTTRYSGRKISAEMLIKILVGGINRRVDSDGAKVFRTDIKDV